MLIIIHYLLAKKESNPHSSPELNQQVINNYSLEAGGNGCFSVLKTVALTITYNRAIKYSPGLNEQYYSLEA